MSGDKSLDWLLRVDDTAVVVLEVVVRVEGRVGRDERDLDTRESAPAKGSEIFCKRYRI